MNSLKAWVERRPMRAVLVAAVIALLIGSQIGLLVGYKIEHDRTAADVRRLKKTNGTTPTTKTTSARVGGKATAVGATSITLKTKSGADRPVNLSSTTAFETAAPATKSDLTVRRHVLVIAPGSEILILPQGSTLGRAITEVTADSFTLAPANGLPGGKIKLSSKSVIEQIKPGAKADVKVGGQVLAIGTAVKSGPVAATEIVTLPAASKFGG